MQPSDFSPPQRRHLQQVEKGLWAYVPPTLPPDWQPEPATQRLLSQADIAIGRLDGIGRTMRNPHLLIRPFIRREAVLSSQIEGTQTDQRDLALFEVEPGRVQTFDAQEVHNYVRALDYALQRQTSLPVSQRLIREMHGILMQQVRGQHDAAGELRKLQNWIGPEGATKYDARYVPPPVPQMCEALDKLEAYIHQPHDLPPLVRLAMIHYQFEAIHPFNDGNGRLGRLLITALLCVWEVLNQPLLYLSAYFMKHRQAYYQHLLNVSTRGDWNAWVEFFLRGIVEQAEHAAGLANRLYELNQQMHERMHQARSSALVHPLIDRLFETPATTGNKVIAELDITAKTAYRLIDKLVEAGILTEITGQQRDRVWLAQPILDLSAEPITPPEGPTQTTVSEPASRAAADMGA